MLAVTKGWDRAQVRQIVRETMLQTIEPIMYAEALELMELHRAAGHRVYLVSASPEEIVLPLADLLGVDGAICSRGEVDEQGRYTGRMAFYAYGESQGDRHARAGGRAPGIDLAASSAYSDSATDLPMLEAVGPPGRGQPRPRAGQGGARARLGDAQLHEADPPARPGRAHDAGGDDEPRRRRRGAHLVAARPARPSRAPGRPAGAPPSRAIARRRPDAVGARAGGGRRRRRGRPAGRGSSSFFMADATDA